MNLNQSSYNKIADRWAAERHQSFVSQLVIDFAAMVKPGGHILDIGCGTGFLAEYLIQKGFRLTGIDITENLLQMALNRQLPTANFILVDFFEYNPVEHYDGVLAFDSFFHFPKERQHEIYARVSQWMNAGAPILFTHGNKDGEIRDTMYDEIFYYSCLDTAEVHRLMQEAGLEIVKTIEYYKERDMDRDLVVLGRRVDQGDEELRV